MNSPGQSVSSTGRSIPDALRYVLNFLRDDGGGDRGEKWNHSYWEPVKISVGALFALVLKAGFDNAQSYLRLHPTEIYEFPSWHEVHAQVTVVAELITLLTWATMSYFTNVRWYFQIPASPSRLRIFGFATLLLNFGLFYFFAGSIGPVSNEQILLVIALLWADVLVVNLGLRPLLSQSYIRTRTVRRLLESSVGILGVAVLPKGDYMAFAFLALILLQAAALEGRPRIPKPISQVEREPLPAEVIYTDAPAVDTSGEKLAGGESASQ